MLMGFAGFDMPKEHKLRKPKGGFKKQKKQWFTDLYDSKESRKILPPAELSKNSLERAKKKRNWKMTRDVTIFLSIIIPLSIFANYFFYKKIEENNFKVSTSVERFRINNEKKQAQIISQREKIFNGVSFLNGKEYQKAIFSFSSLNKKYPNNNWGTYGLLATYDELCESGNIYYCKLLDDSLWKIPSSHYLKKDSKEVSLKKLRKKKEKLIKRFKKNKSSSNS